MIILLAQPRQARIHKGEPLILFLKPTIHRPSEPRFYSKPGRNLDSYIEGRRSVSVQQSAGPTTRTKVHQTAARIRGKGNDRQGKELQKRNALNESNETGEANSGKKVIEEPSPPQAGPRPQG